MKRLFLFLALLFIPTMVFAAQRTVIVNGSGVEIGPTKSEATAIQDAGDQNALITGAATIYSLVVTGASAGDVAALHDSLVNTESANVFLEVKVSANTSTNSVSIPGGIKVSTGVSVGATDSDVIYTVVYEQ